MSEQKLLEEKPITCQDRLSCLVLQYILAPKPDAAILNEIVKICWRTCRGLFIKAYDSRLFLSGLTQNMMGDVSLEERVKDMFYPGFMDPEHRRATREWIEMWCLEQLFLPREEVKHGLRTRDEMIEFANRGTLLTYIKNAVAT